MADDSRALYVAEAGLSAGIAMVQDSTVHLKSQEAGFGAPEAPLPFGAGGYWGSVVPNEPSKTITVTAFSQVAGRTRGLEAVMSQSQEGIYDNALTVQRLMSV